MMMSKLTKGGLVITGLALRGLSTACTGWLCYQLAEGEVARWLAASGGVFIQLGAFMALPVSVGWLVNKQFLRALPGLAYSLVVFSVSTMAAIAFLEYGEQVQREVVTVDQTTTLYQEAAKEDLKNGFRGRALATLDKVSEREQVERAVPTVASIVADLYGVSIHRLRQLAWLVLAVLMDAGGVLSSVLPVLAKEKTSDDDEQGQEEKPTDDKELDCSETGQDRPEQPEIIIEQQPSRSADYDRGLALIEGKCSGDEISIQDFKVLLKMGYPKAKNLAKELEQDGRLTSGGKSFIIV